MDAVKAMYILFNRLLTVGSKGAEHKQCKSAEGWKSLKSLQNSTYSSLAQSVERIHQDVFVKSCLYKRWEKIQDKVQDREQDREQDRISFRQIQMFLPKWYFKRAIDSWKVMSDGDEDGEKTEKNLM